MKLEQYAAYDECYRGLRANGWPKKAAADAARRHVKRMKPRELKIATEEAHKAFEYRQRLAAERN